MREVRRSTRVTEAEFMSIPESLDRIELLDGEIILSPSPTLLHQELLVRLLLRFREWAARSPPAYAIIAPLDIRFGPERILQPDLALFVKGRPPPEMPIRVIPELVIEVMSQKKSYDRMTKRLVYSEAGVQELWLVDVDDESIEIVRGLNTVEVTHTIARSQLPGLELDVTGLFAP